MKKLFTLLLISIFIIEVSAQCTPMRYNEEAFTNVDVTTVKFGEVLDESENFVQDLNMDIYQPQGDTLENRPVIVFCFGGSFIAGSRTSGDIVYMCEEFAKRGYVTAAIDYRLAGPLDMLQEENMVKEVLGAVGDGKAAIRFFRKDADTDNTYKIDVDQIFIGGTSAGGILGINLAYADDLAKLPASWQTWMTEIGGLEGNSGNEGYCSKPNGTFGFAGAIADTAWIDSDDVPCFMTHSEDDATVPFAFGTPLNGLAPVDLMGSSLIAQTMDDRGIYNVFLDYAGSSHPPFQGTIDMSETRDNLESFLYSILLCNPDNENQEDVDNCYKTVNPNAIRDFATIDAQIYPNPTENVLFIKLQSEDVKEATFNITNTIGQTVMKGNVVETVQQYDISTLPSGI
ncbi:MAG: T9SS type A sorting domain-containing protein, partial [Chitinophagales bacterium]